MSDNCSHVRHVHCGYVRHGSWRSRSVDRIIFKLCCDAIALFYSGRACIVHCGRLNVSTVVSVATVDLLGMTTMVGVAERERVESGASPRGDIPDVGAGKGGVRSIKCEPTPVPTAGEKMRSSSSLGSKSGCLRLDRDPLGIWRFL